MSLKNEKLPLLDCTINVSDQESSVALREGAANLEYIINQTHQKSGIQLEIRRNLSLLWVELN